MNPFSKGGRTRFAADGARSATLASLNRQPGGEVLRNRIFVGLLFAAVSIAMVGLALILIDAFLEGKGKLSLDLITGSTSNDPDRAGFQQAILGTIWLIGFVILLVVPVGVVRGGPR